MTTTTLNTPDAAQPAAPKTTKKEREQAPSLGQSVRFFFSKPGPKIVAAAWLTTLIARVFVGQWSPWELAILGGVLAFWPFQEWLIHVFILHFKPRRLGSLHIDPFVANKHRRHHADPWDIDLSFTPLRGVFLVIALNAALWFGLMPSANLALAGMLTYLSFGLLYEWTHFLVHTRYRPKSRLYKHIWKHHRLHHCKNENYWYGVSMTLGDYVLRTAPDQREVETSPTCKSVHPER